MSFRRVLEQRPWLQAVLLLAVAAAALAPNLRAGFVWDDIQQIVDSQTIADPAAPRHYFSLNVAQSSGSEGRGADGVDTYRPLFFVALWAIHHINGADSFWFHMAVICAHLAVCLLVWSAARRWVGSTMVAAAVFLAVAIHPVTAEAYLWASAISEPMAAAGLLSATLVLDRCRGNDRREFLGAAIAGLLMLLGLLAKEAALTALPVVSLYLWRVRGVRLRALTAPWVAAFVFLAMRTYALGGVQATGTGAEQRLEAIRNLPVLVLDGLRAMFTLRPVGIRHLYWDYHHLGWALSLVAAALVLVLALLAWWVRRPTPLLPTALGVLICMLAPVALVATVPGWGGFGRYLYVPWCFAALAMGEAGMWAHARLARRWPRIGWSVPLVAVVFLLIEALGLSHAHEVYRSQENLARSSIELAPHAPDGWEWLGNHCIAEGDIAGAARCYAEAVTIAPELYRPRHNLAAALLYLDQPAKALEHEVIAESQHGTTSQGIFVIVSALIELDRWNEAATRLVAGLDLDPTNPRLRQLQSRLLDEHPDPDGYRRWLESQLAAVPNRPAGSAIRSLLR